MCYNPIKMYNRGYIMDLIFFISDNISPIYYSFSVIFLTYIIHFYTYISCIYKNVFSYWKLPPNKPFSFFFFFVSTYLMLYVFVMSSSSYRAFYYSVILNFNIICEDNFGKRKCISEGYNNMRLVKNNKLYMFLFVSLTIKL